MRKESPLRAQPDSRILDYKNGQQQGQLFAELNSHSEEQLLADYRQRYGLSEDPFADDYSFPLFTGAGRRQLLDQLLHLSQFSNSLLVVVGEYGVGKTRIAHAFMDSLSEVDQVCFISVAAGQTLEPILLSMAESFGLDVDGAVTVENLLSILEDFIGEEQDAELDGLAVVVLDNAHLLDDQTISVIVSLLHSFPQQNRLHFVLVGEPAVVARIERYSDATLLINDFYVHPFTVLESVDYLNFRMEMADYLGPEIFTESLVDAWWRQAQGQLPVLHELAQERLLESVMSKKSLGKRPLPIVHIVAIAALITVVGILFLYMGDDEPAPAIKPAITVVPVPVSSPTANTQSAAASSIELASTATPVQPILQSLPQSAPATQLPPAEVPPAPVNAPATPTSVASTADVEEHLPQQEVVPLAQLPTAPPRKVSAATSATVAASAATKQAVPATTSVAREPAQEAIKPVKPAPKEKPALVDKMVANPASGQAQDILSWTPSEYTIQLLGVSSEKAAREYVAAQPNKKDLLVFKSKRQNKDWFVVITGRFANSAQARQAINALPAAQRNAGPWQRDIKTIQKEIKTAL